MSSRLLLKNEGAAGSDRVVDHLEHRSAASEAEQMSRPGHRSAIGAIRDDLQTSATAGEPHLVVKTTCAGFGPGAPWSGLGPEFLLSVGKAGWSETYRTLHNNDPANSATRRNASLQRSPSQKEWGR